jgi:hypothetical protein
MNAFSDRIGKTVPKTILQLDAIDKDLRNGLWQACIERHIKRHNPDYSYDHVFRNLMIDIYVNFFKRASDTIPFGHDRGISVIRDWFFSAEWWNVYSFIEFLFRHKDDSFLRRVTFFLEREKSGYRVVNGRLAAISDAIEIEAVSDASSVGGPFSSAASHMKTAVSLFSQKPSPDYRNAIKEAISAVEATARIVTGHQKATLGEALKRIDDKMTIHPALRDAMNKLYGYSSDEGGIRHALLTESTVDEAEAKFMIVACSAFVNFCVQRHGSE